jgi:hypothetical protein
MNRERIRSRVYSFLVTEERQAGASNLNDAFFYQTEDVVSILEGAWPEDSPEDEDAMVAASDIRWAFTQLSYDYQYRILERYRHGVTRPHDSNERAQLNRAVRKLADILNTWNMSHGHEGPGSRKVISNDRANWEIEHQSQQSANYDPWGWSR